MMETNNLQVEVQKYNEDDINFEFDLDRIIYDFDNQIALLSSQADKLDYIVSIASGVLCGMLDILWVGEFSLERGRDIASDEVDSFVIKTAKMIGHDGDNIEGAVKFLEKKFYIPSDGNTPDFGGGLQHHLRDFAHHPTIVGFMFSLLTQFTYKSYGTDTKGVFIIKDVTKKSKAHIGADVPSKILNGTLTWFFHLVSDVAGSSNTAGKSGGTGIPGPLLSLAKEVSALPIFKNINEGENSLSKFLSKLFNGTLLAKHDEAGRIIKDTELRFDLRGELGLGIELGRQAIPVVANECFVRCFYFIRHLALEIGKQDIQSISEIKQIDRDKVKPLNTPTIDRMITISTGVFATINIGHAIASQKYWVSINYIGVGRFALAIGEDVAWSLKGRNLKKIRQMYKDIQKNTYVETDNKIYGRISSDMNIDKFGLTIEQTEILYNLEYYKTLNEIQKTKTPLMNEAIKSLKQDWLNEWKRYITKGFSDFIQIEDADIHWYTKEELVQKVEDNDPYSPWFRLVLLETMLFEPFYPMTTEKNKKDNEIPSKKYKSLNNPVNGYKKNEGDHFIDSFFISNYYEKGYIKRLRKCYNEVVMEMKEVTKGIIKGGAITAGIAIATIATAGALAPKIAVVLVGSKFAGLGGAALTSASLAYLGGGAIAVGGAGMAGGTMAIVGGGAALGIGAGLGIGGFLGASEIIGKENTILQSAKLLVSVREIFLNDEHDLEYSNSIYEQYVQNIMDIEKDLVELKLKADVANEEEKKELELKIKNAEDSVKAMKIARKNLRKFMSSFEEGLEKS